ncbi:MAG TPA: choice-of-anchor Q domain-containing protein [Polyangiaceae bacterium]|nr:choice-of-anchor Q domain-containing protein [Polyangiaceae bacterium]
MLASPRAQARTYNVTPSSGCSLALAIQAVNTQTAQGSCLAGDGNADTINLASGTYTFTNTLYISRSVVLDGAGVGSTIVRSNMASDSQLFWVIGQSGGITVRFVEMTIDKASTQTYPTVTGIYVSGDASTSAGVYVERSRVAGHTWSGVYADDAHLTINDSIIESNSSPGPGGGIGVQANGGTASIFTHESTINNNSSQDSGGGVYFGGNTQSQLINTTVSSNTALRGGGVAYNATDWSNGYFNLVSSTVTENSASQTGGGVYTPQYQPGIYEPNFVISGTIVANNFAHFLQDWDGHLHVTTDSLIGDTFGLSEIDVEQGINFYDVDPLLDSVLRDLGGPYHTKVHRLLPGSPAIDVLSSSTSTDQRHVLRPQLGRTSASMSDIGAYEETRQETELLTVAAKTAGVSHVVVNASQYSNGQGTNLQSTAANHFLTYSTPASLPSGTYQITVGFKKGSNAGRFQFAVASSLGGTYTNLGAVQDGYASSNTWTSVTLPNHTFGSSSTKYLRFTVVSKNGSSSGYQVFPDYITITKQ